jgi:hypothetical protein
MKTAMQELISELKRVEDYPMMPFVIRMATDLLEKEKEQIIQARIDGDENYSLVGGKRYEYAEQYYNQTYNQNE